MNTYVYDSANRLISVDGTESYSYNGLGDRLTQNNVHYTLDLNTGLTQVLEDGENTYLYGNGRISQTNTQTEYFMGDALGSVRQLTDANAEITLVKSYAPYGETMSSAGIGASPFAYTGEITDVTGLTYLRARYYNPADGRFMTRDTWEGNQNQPMSHNGWLYVYGNPVNLKDPSGHDPWWCEDQYNEDICYAQWIIANRGQLTSDILEAVFRKDPDEALQLLQQQFKIKLPAGYYFRYAAVDSPAFFQHKDAKGVNWWLTEYLPLFGDLLEISDDKCSLLSSRIPAQAIHIDYSIYITKRAFTDFEYFYPDDIAAIMIHEATHAWQESVARTFVVAPGQPADPASYEWFGKHLRGIERQADDRALDAKAKGRVEMSQSLFRYLRRHKSSAKGGPDFPYPIPPNVP